MSEIFTVEIAESNVVSELPAPDVVIDDPLFEQTVDRAATHAKVSGRTALDTRGKLDALLALARAKKVKLAGIESEKWLVRALVHRAFPDKPSAAPAHWIRIRVQGLRGDSGMISKNDTYGFRSFVLRLLADAPDKQKNAIRKKLGDKLDEAKFQGAATDVWDVEFVSRTKIGSDGGQPLFQAELSTVLPSALTGHIAKGLRYPSWAFWYQPGIK
jgi:hypothetical protein